MKIVQVITRPQRRGAEIFAVQLSEKLLEFGHEVTVISLFWGPDSFEFSGSWIRLDLENKWKVDFSGFRRLAEVLRTINPEVVQANASETLRMTVGAKWFFGGGYKLVYRNANQISQFIRHPFQKFWNKALLNQVDAVVSVSESSKNDFLATFGWKKPIENIPIGIEPGEMDRKLADLGLEGVFPFPFLLHIGALVPEKNPFELVKLCSEEIFPKFKDLHLVFLGSGSLDQELRMLVAQKKLADRIHLIPNQVNPFPILRQAKALVMPSKIEGLPAVILEAMYCKVPVVAYGVGGIGEVLKSGETGWLVPAGDIQAFGSALHECLTMPESGLQKITESAKKLVEQGYDLGRVAEDFVLFYQKRLPDGF